MICRRLGLFSFRSLVVIGLIAGPVAAIAVASQTPTLPPASATTPQAAPARAGRGGGLANAYPQHAQADQASIDRGKALFDVNCSFCHGSDARGGEGGPNLLRSQLVMNDQSGEAIALVVQNGRLDRGMPKFDLTSAQISDIAAFVHSFRVAGYDLSRDIPPNVVVGDAKAGEAYFNGAGKCASCHSVTDDLAGIAGKLDAKTLQNAIVAGGVRRGAAASSPPPTTVTVTLSSGKSYEGKLESLDDFVVSLTDPQGNLLSFERTGNSPRVQVHNPLQAHFDMLAKYTDDEIHNLTAYLVTLK
jgi:cytochrome c oxidase cbb3-type subunit 3